MGPSTSFLIICGILAFTCITAGVLMEVKKAIMPFKLVVLLVTYVRILAVFIFITGFTVRYDLNDTARTGLVVLGGCIWWATTKPMLYQLISDGVKFCTPKKYK